MSDLRALWWATGGVALLALAVGGLLCGVYWLADHDPRQLAAVIFLAIGVCLLEAAIIGMSPRVKLWRREL